MGKPTGFIEYLRELPVDGLVSGDYALRETLRAIAGAREAQG